MVHSFPGRRGAHRLPAFPFQPPGKLARRAPCGPEASPGGGCGVRAGPRRQTSAPSGMFVAGDPPDPRGSGPGRALRQARGLYAWDAE